MLPGKVVSGKTLAGAVLPRRRSASINERIADRRPSRPRARPEEKGGGDPPRPTSGVTGASIAGHQDGATAVVLNATSPTVKALS